MPGTFIILILSILMLFANATTAQNRETDIEQLNAKILELQQQINELAAETGKQEAKDELAALRELAKAKAAEEVIPEEDLGGGLIHLHRSFPPPRGTPCNYSRNSTAPLPD